MTVVKAQELILIVDDEPTAQATLRGLLIRDGYEFAVADNAGKTLDLLLNIEPDLILLDVMMPGVDGLALCAQLKQMPTVKHIPIILVTALDGDEYLELGFKAGADDFITKPINGYLLRTRVRSLLRIKRQFDELQGMMQLREDLSRMLMHDMRTPLMSILGFTQMLILEGRDSFTPTQLQDLGGVYKQARRLNRFIDDMLLLAKMEADKLLLNLAPTDGNTLIKAVLKSHRSVARGKEIELIADLPPESLNIDLDESLFERVLDNLLANSIKYSPENSAIWLVATYGASDGPYRLKIEVRDQGPGIPHEYRQQVFNKFEIAELKSGSFTQVGLGLAFCKMVVDAHGGRIYVRDNQPDGAVFVVEI